MNGLSVVPKRSRSLFDHVRDVDGIAELLDSLDRAGELTQEITEQLQEALIVAVAGTRAKVDRCAGVLCNFEAAEASARAEIERLTKRAAKFRRQREYLETVCLAVLDQSNLDVIDGETASIARHKLPLKVLIEDEPSIPVEFLRWPDPIPDPGPEPDKKLIAAALKRDPTGVPGCRMAPRTYKLVRS